ncbi:MAG TPA: hypothetical protein VFG50_13550 [Rhodothermales bacterium]|nr:hypothetical protein [Rhodothermales bacterium]
MAERTPVDSLKLVWRVKGPDVSLEHPRTVLFGPDGRLYVSDTKRAQIALFSEDGRRLGEIALPEFKHPYLAGFRGDTLLVFNPDAGRIDFVQGGAVRRSVSVPVDVKGDNALTYAAASDSALYVKALSEDTSSYIVRLDEAGNVTRKETLDGPYWRYAGLLRMWGDSLLSFSGYRPVVDVLTPRTQLDSLVLMGFDSPMLARTRLFMLDEIDQAPLLSSSAAPAGGLLFVLNMRPGWLRIDVYDHAGQLQRVLLQRHPDYDRTYFPVDLAVRPAANGAYDIAVATAATRPSLSLFRWMPGR